MAKERKANLYAKLDDDRKPWWIVAVRGHDVNEWRLCTTDKQRDEAVKSLIEKYGTDGLHFCFAEGYYNIEG